MGLPIFLSLVGGEIFSLIYYYLGKDSFLTAVGFCFIFSLTTLNFLVTKLFY